MSSKTKIVVLKARELIYTGIFILLGILLILLLIFMFVPSHKSKKAKETSMCASRNLSVSESYSILTHSSRLVNCYFGDPWENRTPVCGVRGRRLSRLTNGP